MVSHLPLPRLIVTMDIEDWPQSTWDHSLEITQRSATNTERVLDILQKYSCTITMFVLGKFAERFPAIVRRISEEGHEIASHGYGHIELSKQTPNMFRQDVARSKHLLEDIIGQQVVGYRAPDYSITSSELWTLDILAELGFVYDSSIFPSSFTRYGISEWPSDPVQVILPSGLFITEFPLTTLSLFGQRLPVAGGGYHRLLPWPVIRWIIKSKLYQEQPFITYCHPYEFDPVEFSHLELNLPLKTRLHQGLGRRGFQWKFERMISTFESIKAVELLADREWSLYRIPKHLYPERGSK